MSTASPSQDKLVLYASLFLYRPKLRNEFASYAPSILAYECTCSSLTTFLSFPDAPTQLQSEVGHVPENE